MRPARRCWFFSSAPDYIKFDRARMATESEASALSGMFPQPDNKVYEEERKEANRMAHRGQDLEAAITNIQLGPLATACTPSSTGTSPHYRRNQSRISLT